MPVPKEVENYYQLYKNFEEALATSEDVRIELTQSFEYGDLSELDPAELAQCLLEYPSGIPHELPAINHGYLITVASKMGATCALASPQDANMYFRHFFIQNGGLVLENIILCGGLDNQGPQPVPSPPLEDGPQKSPSLMEKLAALHVLHEEPNLNFGGVEIRTNGSLRMKQGSVITNCKGLVAGGVYIKEGGSFLMTSGEIRDCLAIDIPYGDLVYANGTFLMRDGTLSFTYQDQYTGVYVGEAGTFVMEGGTIEHCINGIYLDRSSTFQLEDGIIRQNDIGIETNFTSGKKLMVINGGMISKNRIGIALADGADLTLNGGEISDHTQENGIGILAAYGTSGSFVMNGGRIHHNVQGLVWQQTDISCTIHDGEIYENGFGIGIDNAVVTFRNGKIYNSRGYDDDGALEVPIPQLGGYPLSGIGVVAGFQGVFNFENGEIFGNERMGIYAVFTGTVNFDGGRVYGNRVGIRLTISKLLMSSGLIYQNTETGVEVSNFSDEFEADGSVFEMIDGQIYGNGNGVIVSGLSTFLMKDGEIFGHQPITPGVGEGVWAQSQSHVEMVAGRVYKNYRAFRLEADSTFHMFDGKIEENTIGVTVGDGCTYIMEDGEICNNYGYLGLSQSEGGLGIGISYGTFKMLGGKIYGHRGFPVATSLQSFNQRVGAAIAILHSAQSVELIQGEITDNMGAAGAAVYVPTQIYSTYSPLKIEQGVYFNNNQATDEPPYDYQGAIQHVDQNIRFAHTSVGTHALNNYDINYTAGAVIGTKLSDFFPDPQFAALIAEQLNREPGAYIVKGELGVITALMGDDRGISSIEGAQYLTQLETLSLNGNHIWDLSPLTGLPALLWVEAFEQQITLPQIYVSQKVNFSPTDMVGNRILLERFKYSGSLLSDTEEIIWWERGRNQLKWKTQTETPQSNFTGTVNQISVPIPIESLFPDAALASAVARTLNKMISSPIDITELLRLSTLKLWENEAHTLEGLQFLFNLKYLDLRQVTGIPTGEIDTLVAAGVKVLV